MSVVETRDGLKINYQLRGEGEPLTLIMGFGGSGRAWGEPFLSRLERHFKLLVIDNRGTGESDKPERPWSLLDMANDAAQVLDREKIERTHLMGISMGGMIAQEFALNHANRLRRLVIGCTNCGPGHSVAAPMEVVMNLVPAPGLSPLEQAKRAFAACLSPAFVESASGKAFLDQMMVELAKFPPTPAHTYMLQMGAIQGFDSFPRLATLKMPTLVITGDADRIVPPQNSEILHQNIPGSKLHFIKGPGHMFVWENPDEAAQVVTNFLSDAR